MAIIGIDLGTTNSLCAIYQNGKVELIPNRYGSYLTPSVVSLAQDDTILVGFPARERLITHPSLTAASFKQDMGTDRVRHLGEKTFRPEELSSFVIRSLLQDAKAYLAAQAKEAAAASEPITEAVISVPAYFQDRQRVAVKQAGALAGVTVNRIVNEPSAAALAAYMDPDLENNYRQPDVFTFETGQNAQRDQEYLVFDFGGGTLDVSLVSCYDDVVEITAVAGDNHLGGDNMNAAIADFFMQAHALRREDLNDTEFASLLREAERCKIQLSQQDHAKITVTLQGVPVQSDIDNHDVLQACREIFRKIRDVVGHALKAGGKTAAEMDAVVLAGGSSKMPLVQSFLRHLFQGVPLVSANPEEMIVRGVGYVCGMMQHDKTMQEYIMTDICPFTLGTGVRNPSDPRNLYMSAIIPRNSVLPVSRSGSYCTASDNQQYVKIDVFQGEHPYVKDNTFLGELMLPVPPRKAGEVKVDVRFTYDINGILIVDATVHPGEKKYSKVISQTLTGKALEEKVQALERYKVSPEDDDENKLIKERLEAVYESSGGALKEYTQNALMRFEAALKREDPVEIRKIRRYIRDFLRQVKDYDPFATEVTIREYHSEDYQNDDGAEDDFDWDNL